MDRKTILPDSMLEMASLPQAPAFEMRDGKLVIKFEPDIPSIRIGTHEFRVTDAPCVIVGGKKILVSGIA